MFTNAIMIISKVLACDSQNLKAYYRRALAHMENKDYDSSE